jgi:hypothetical protein
MTLQQINEKGKLDENNGELTIYEKIIGLVYFRSAYDESNFPSEVIINIFLFYFIFILFYFYFI